MWPFNVMSPTELWIAGFVGAIFIIWLFSKF